MKKLLVLSTALFLLSGCAKQFEAIEVALTPRPNPITEATLLDVEKGLLIASAGLVTYRELCLSHAIPATCRGTIVYLQDKYTKPAKVVIANLRRFVKNNDQVNAITAYDTIKDITKGLEAETPKTGDVKWTSLP